MPMKIFISHSFDHPEKFARIREFVAREGIPFLDHSIPAWDPYNGPNVQAEIERRIRRTDRVIVIVTQGMQSSPWIEREIEWARHYGKEIVGVYEHGQAGAPIPAALAEADPRLIGWRATSLAKALRDEDVTSIRAVDLAEDADRERLIAAVLAAAGGISLLMVGAELINLRRLCADLERRGVLLDTRPTPVLMPTLKGAAVGVLLGYLLGRAFGRTSTAARNFAVAGGIVGGAYSLHRILRAEVRRLGPLAEFDVKPAVALPTVSRLALPRGRG